MKKIKPSDVIQFNKVEVIRSIKYLIFHNQLNKEMLQEILRELDIRENFLKNSNLVRTREYRESLGLSRENFWSLFPYNAINLHGRAPKELLEEVKEALKIKDDEEEIIKILKYVNSVLKIYRGKYLGRNEFNLFKKQFYNFKHTYLSNYIRKHRKTLSLFLEEEKEKNSKFLVVESENNFSFHIPWGAKKNIKLPEDLQTREYNRPEVNENLEIANDDYFNKVFILISYYNLIYER